MVQGQLLEGRHGVHPAGGVDVEVDADEVVRGPAAGDSVAGGPGGGGEEGAYGGWVRGGVVDAVSGETAGAPARDRPVLVVVGRAQSGELGGGQRDDGEPVLGGGERVGEGQGGGLPVGNGHSSMFVQLFEERKGWWG